jgi:UDP-4-amino-4,6-dideoxy-N-acetyl-beta-L-altrosamine transaminase
MRERIPYSCQTIDETDIAEVADCLRSAFLTQGPRVAAFEREAAAWLGARHAVAVSNGTAALHLACQALGLGSGGLVWTSPNSFVASANAARYLGADVDFADIDPATGSIAPDALAQKLTEAAAKGRLPDILIAVHFAGHTPGFARIADLCTQHGVKLIEDAAHAFGAVYEDDPACKVGAYPQSDAATFSFHPLKSITTGEGGMVTTGSDEVGARLAMLRSHGITKEPDALTAAGPEDGGWYYEQHALGFNYRLCDIQAALGLSQLRRLDTFMAARRGRAQRYRTLLAGLPLTLPPATAASSWHLFVVHLDHARTNVSRRALFDRLRARGIEAHVHYIPIHLQPYYRALGFGPGDFPAAEDYYETCLSLPIYPSMTDEEQDFVASELKDALEVA